MKLVAIYIKKNFLFSETQTINLGGKYFYKISAKENIENQHNITRAENPNFIEGFWGENISMVSAIVGENGSGKTNVLKIINSDFRENSKYILLYEDGNTCYIQNRTGNKDKNENIINASNDIFIASGFVLDEFKTSLHESLYFSNAYDRGIKKISSFLPLNSKNIDDSINEIEDRNLLLQIQLMNNPIIDDLKKAYQDFPKFDFLQIKSNPLSKWDLRKIYIDTNIGFTNILKKIRDDFDHDFERLIERLNEDKFEKEEIIKEIQFNRFIIEISDTPNLLRIFTDIISNALNSEIHVETTIEQHYFNLPKKITLTKNNNEEIDGITFRDLNQNHKERLYSIIQNIETAASTTNLLDEVWKKYPIFTNSNSGKTHEEGNLLKNFEVNILSLLILNDTFAITGLEANFKQYNYNNVRNLINSNEDNFEAILNQFLHKYFAQNHGFIYKKILEKFGNELLNADETLIKEEILKYGISSNGIKIDDVRRKMNNDLQGIFSIRNIYYFLKENLSDSEIKFDLAAQDMLVKMQNFLALNQGIRTYFNSLPSNEKELFYYDIGKNFSYGEKSLLNLFAQFFEFKVQENIKHYGWQNLNILLDEADLGFHPEWKRKFIYAITTVFSVLFSDENLQIIITTHDPLTLSDIPNSNVVYLKKERDKTRVLDQKDKPKQSFGANITDLLADSFFISDGLIGDFAKGKIENTIRWINIEKYKKNSISQQPYKIDEDEYEKYKKIIELIDEKIVKMKLAEMIDELKPEKDFQKELAEKEIEYLKNKFGL
ncbi:AAA family ATPase [Chryseobacterium caseinilyticum]|uniref:ATPase AAA-type core domain-containing protein n=1 Tax=Chryseobacterium caseinilyticum TaxID=2771428 RepID=A0ABR8Z9X5_9FLAO|nr:hypothetical protein [Chryseobacterium caseinilyticum]MBD8081581.1 hypothetical protein [Chryseobacterium caseinilyticum]